MLNVKNIFSIAFLALLTSTGYCQEFEVIKLDENISVPVPHKYKILDTNGVLVTFGQIGNCKAFTSKVFAKDYDLIRSEEDLLSFYDGFQNRSIENKKGDLIETKTETIKHLLCRTYSFYETIENKRHVEYHLLLFINKNLYAISFLELESEHEKVKTLREDYFSRIEPSSTMNFNNQITVDTAYNIGYFLGSVFIYILLITTVLLLLIWFFRRRKKKRQILSEKY